VTILGVDSGAGFDVADRPHMAGMAGPIVLLKIKSRSYFRQDR
jgi:hypothetical protein